jgi:glycosyltransferase involved in cell wall biosynthesis
MKIFSFHLLNDYSGSPKVLMQSINAWVNEGYQVTIVTCKGKEGFLSNIPRVSYKYFWYKLASNRYQRLLFLIWSQLLLLGKLLFVVKKEDIIYINTVLPFGAAFLGMIKRCRVVYHIHETSIKPLVLKKLLFGIVKLASDDVIYVSNYLAKQEKFENKNITILHNAIENSFLKIANANKKQSSTYKNVLMVCSLKWYKGVNEFLELSQILVQYNFRLVVNATQEEINHYFINHSIPKNLKIYSTQTDLHSFFQWSDVVLNLSKPNGWIETFGLTVIEAMAYGLPVIVPPIGGIAELVEEGVNGFHANSDNINGLTKRLIAILENQNLYTQMKHNAYCRILDFSEDVFSRKSINIIKNRINKSQMLANNLKFLTNE